jgi:Tfp pilus assembly protein PilZ
MTPPPPDASVRLRLKCRDAEDFVERFAPNVTRGGIFLPARDAREVGATIRFEIALLDGTVVFAGEGVVTWAKPKGLGVKFTTLDPATEPVLERLLSRRAAAAVAPQSPAPTQAGPAPAPSPAPGPATAWESLAAELARPTPPAMQASSTAAAALATDSSPLSFEPRTRRPLVRVALVCSAVFAGIAVVWMSIGRARVRTGSPAEPAGPATVEIAERAVAAPALGTTTPPPAVSSSRAPEPPTEVPPAVPPPTSAPRSPSSPPASARSGGLRVEKILAGTSYQNFTCPNPITRFSAKSNKTVNVCLQVTHRPGKSDRLTLVWERNGTFAGKTRVALPASKSTLRTRAHMKIGANRVGSWSVRAVSDRDAPLAQTTFDVVP